MKYLSIFTVVGFILLSVASYAQLSLTGAGLGTPGGGGGGCVDGGSGHYNAFLARTGASVTGTIVTTVMTVSATASGNLAAGQNVSGSSITPGTTITSLGTYNGSTGTVNLSTSNTVSVGETITASLNTTYQNAYCTLINQLDTDSTFAIGDVLQIYASQDSVDAVLNLLSSSYNATTSGSPTFTANQGFTGGGTKAIDTGFNASTAGGHFGSNSMSLFGWTLTSWTGSGSNSGVLIGFKTNTSVAPSTNPYNQSDAHYYQNTYNNAAGSNTAYINGDRMFGFTHTSTGPSSVFFDNKTSHAALSNNVDSLVNEDFNVLGDNFSGTYRPYTGIATAFWAGGFLNTTQQGKVYDAICAFLVSVNGSC